MRSSQRATTDVTDHNRPSGLSTSTTSEDLEQYGRPVVIGYRPALAVRAAHIVAPEPPAAHEIHDLGHPDDAPTRRSVCSVLKLRFGNQSQQTTTGGNRK